jgi:hypothetical protein
MFDFSLKQILSNGSSCCKEIWKTRLIAKPTNIRLSSILCGTDKHSSLLYLSVNDKTKKVCFIRKVQTSLGEKYLSIFLSKKRKNFGAQ